MYLKILRVGVQARESFLRSIVSTVPNVFSSPIASWTFSLFRPPPTTLAFDRGFDLVTERGAAALRIATRSYSTQPPTKGVYCGRFSPSPSSSPPQMLKS